ncbi:hypothetical protein M9H77_24882 [Catharanthus roseus]|uniref:Uncharacterized protein n=1 Tax=Catharanthus roseus TaxID=4058 RepID=A0ACC0A659_CATRO|nr:hypothetical protein M9H77_24882 [Catharanthus roseus]
MTCLNDQVLHMIGGEGETSYAKNSGLQRKIISFEDSVIEEAVADIICNHSPESMGIADLGCSSGPNTLLLAHEVIDKVYNICRRIGKPLPELRVCLNDLHVNDFNNVFMSLPEFHGRLEEKKEKGVFNHCFVSAVPGSFYGRLFPRKSSTTTRYRSKCAVKQRKLYILELLAQALTSMVSKGQVMEEKIDSFNAPYYTPSVEEVKTTVEEEGSFAINYFNCFEIEWDVGYPKF